MAAPTATRRRLKPEDRRAELLAAGEAVFSERPYDEVSIDDIAAAAGISKNLLYHYFAGKRELYIETIRAAAADFLAATDLDMSLDPQERLKASIEAHLAHAEAHASGYTALLRGAGSDPEVQEIVTAAHDHVVARTLAALPFPGGAPIEVRLAVRGWVGFVDMLTIHWLERRRPSRARVRDLLVAEFVAVITAAATAAATHAADRPG